MKRRRHLSLDSARRPLPVRRRALQEAAGWRTALQSTRNSGIRTHSHTFLLQLWSSCQGYCVLSHADSRRGTGGRRRGRLPQYRTLDKYTFLEKSVSRIQELPVNPAAGGWRYDGAVDMDKVLNWLFAAMTLLLSVQGEVFKGKATTCNLFGRSECTRVRPPGCRKSVCSRSVNWASPVYAAQLWTRGETKRCQ